MINTTTQPEKNYSGSNVADKKTPATRKTTPRQIDTSNGLETNKNLQSVFDNTKKAVPILRALNHKLRQQIIKLINDRKKLTVSEIYIELRLEQSVTSQHLAILRGAGLVNAIREGHYIYYTINHKRVSELNFFTGQLVGK